MNALKVILLLSCLELGGAAILQDDGADLIFKLRKCGSSSVVALANNYCTSCREEPIQITLRLAYSVTLVVCFESWVRGSRHQLLRQSLLADDLTELVLDFRHLALQRFV